MKLELELTADEIEEIQEAIVNLSSRQSFDRLCDISDEQIIEEVFISRRNDIINLIKGTRIIK